MKLLSERKGCLIMHKLKLADINQGFDLMHAGTSIRAVVTF